MTAACHSCASSCWKQIHPEALADLATALGHLDEDQIARAVEICPAENLIWSSPVLGRRMPPVPCRSLA